MMCAIVCLALAAVGTWSLDYDGVRQTAVAVEDVAPNVCVDGSTVAYDDFDAWERTLRLENRSGADSAVFSKIRELDAEFPVAAGDVCWIGVQDGMVEGVNYARDDAVSAREFGYRRVRLAKGSTLSFEALRKALADYRRIERFLTCDFYNLASASADPTAWAAWHYRDESSDAGVVLAFRRSASPSAKATFRLPQLKGVSYVFESLDDDSRRDVSGKILREAGLDLTLPLPRTSVIYVYCPR